MKKFSLALILYAFLGFGCSDNSPPSPSYQAPNTNVADSCCKDKVKLGQSCIRTINCPCTSEICDKNPSDYSLAHKCPCKATDCVCPR